MDPTFVFEFLGQFVCSELGTQCGTGEYQIRFDFTQGEIGTDGREISLSALVEPSFEVTGACITPVRFCMSYQVYRFDGVPPQ